MMSVSTLLGLSVQLLPNSVRNVVLSLELVPFRHMHYELSHVGN